MIWLWNASCSRCGYKSRFTKYRWFARLQARIHVIMKHPFACMTIAAVNKGRYMANRAH